MDDPEVLKEQYRQLTVDYENAVHSTYIAFASVGAKVADAATWRKALENEDRIRQRREEVLKELLR